MKEWNIRIEYNRTYFTLRCVVEYQSQRLMRIRVYGSKSSLLLENDYPAIRFTNSKKGIRWKLREGKPDFAGEKTAQLLLDIFGKLEHHMKEDFRELYPDLPFYY